MSKSVKGVLVIDAKFIPSRSKTAKKESYQVKFGRSGSVYAWRWVEMLSPVVWEAKAVTGFGEAMGQTPLSLSTAPMAEMVVMEGTEDLEQMRLLLEEAEKF